MIPKKEGYKATFEFFKVICKLRLAERKRLNIELWRMIKSMLQRKS